MRRMSNWWKDGTEEPPPTPSELEAALVLPDEWRKRFAKELKP